MTALAWLVVLAATACDENPANFTAPTPTLEPTFSSISTTIFQNGDAGGRTACVACHANVGRLPDGNLNLIPAAAYAQLVNRASTDKPGEILVIPGDADNSYLVKKLEGRAGIFGARMPLSGPPYLTTAQVQTIRDWIRMGARND